MEKNLDDFKRYLKRQNLSKATIETYVSSVSYFLEQGYEMKAESMSLWKEEELKRTKVSSVATRIYAINKYAGFLRIRYRLKNINIPLPNYVDEILSMNEFKTLCEGLYQDKNYRWYCTFKIIAGTGVRISEAMQISRKDVERGYMDIIGKGTKARRIFFASGLRKSVLPIMPDGPMITCSDRQVRCYMHRFADRYHIPRKVMHPHELRAFFARQFYDRNKDLRLLQSLMGHASIKTTMRYLRKPQTGVRRRISKIVNWCD